MKKDNSQLGVISLSVVKLTQTIPYILRVFSTGICLINISKCCGFLRYCSNTDFQFNYIVVREDTLCDFSLLKWTVTYFIAQLVNSVVQPF